MSDEPKTQALDFVHYLQTAIDFTQEGPEDSGVVEVASTTIPPTLTSRLAIMTVNCADGARFFISVVKLLDAAAPEPVDVGRIADLFAESLRITLSADQFAEMKRKNESNPNPLICASHDYCDSNMVMDAAFMQVVGHPLRVGSDEDTQVWNDAWTLARERHLGVYTPPAANPLNGEEDQDGDAVGRKMGENR